MLRATGGAAASVPRLAALCLGSCLACSTETLAQSVTGTVLGEVRDASRALVPGATVSLLHAGTGYLRTVHSDTAGEYTAPLLPTGTYQITAELTGFNKVAVGNVRVGVDQKVRINLKLTVGEHRRGQADRNHAPEWSELRDPDPDDSGRAPGDPRRQHRRVRRAGLARLG